MLYFKKVNKKKELSRYTLVVQGFYKMLDGLVNILSLGFYNGNFTLEYLFHLKRKYLNNTL